MLATSKLKSFSCRPFSIRKSS